VKKEPGSYIISSNRPDGNLYINNLYFDKGNMHFDGSGATIEFIPGNVFAKPVTNSTVFYSVPTHHRGKEIKDNTNLIKLAILGVKFYENYLNQIEEKIFQINLK
jgi:hypothetical protein